MADNLDPHIEIWADNQKVTEDWSWSILKGYFVYWPCHEESPELFVQEGEKD